MKKFKVNFAIIAVLIGSALAIGTSANANKLTKRFTAGWYETSQTTPATPIGSDLGTNKPSGVCPSPLTPQCIAKFDGSGNLVSGTLENGTFSD